MYERSNRCIVNQKYNGIKCHVNANFYHGRFQTNANDTETFGLRLGYIFIQKRNFEIQKV